jgi:hypothetical protein
LRESANGAQLRHSAPEKADHVVGIGAAERHDRHGCTDTVHGLREVPCHFDTVNGMRAGFVR